MKFRTEYLPRHCSFTLSPDRPVVLLGSCFSENIAGRMREALWHAENPLGTLYNPLSIASALKAALGEDDPVASLFRVEDTVHSWLFDSGFSSASEAETLSRIADAGERLDAMLKKAEALFVTLGTSWCYFLDGKDSRLVANCHKQPSAMFTRRRLYVEECVECWSRTGAWLRERYPGLRIVFTVSPVRHLKDGFHGNALSKAVLLLAVERLCGESDCFSYFPAYEIMNDDLRDYRFYGEDLVHPSAQGVEYIWEKFRETYLDAAGEALLREGERLCKAAGHRTLIPGKGEEERLRQLQQRFDGFSAAHPDMLGFRDVSGSC